MRSASLLAAGLLALSFQAHAGEVYGGAGLPGVFLGYAQPLDKNFTVRGDIATLGSYSERRTEDGVPFQAKINAHRAGLFGDWFIAGGFRLTAGITFNDVKASLDAQGDGATEWDIDGTKFVAGPNDRFNVKVEYPKTTPYIGLGYGHHAGDTGWGFVFDIGASIGKPKVSETHSGPGWAAAGITQAQIDAEMAEVRDDVGKIKAIPQISIGVNYRF